MNTHRPLAVLSLLAVLAGPAAPQTTGAAAQDGKPATAEAAGAGTAAPAPAAPAPATTAGADAGGAAGAQAAPAGDPTLAGRVVPSALHLGSFSSMRAARLGADGALDTGAAVLQLLDGETGQPLHPATLEYGAGPELYAGWEHVFGKVTVSVRMLAQGNVRNGDDRTKALVHLVIVNRTDAASTVKLGARLMAGGGDPARRPLPALDFRPGVTFARAGDLITRDGSVVMTWSGQDPAGVEIFPSPAAPGAPAVALSWALEMPPQTARYLDLFMAGPNASGTVDESSWRDGIAHWSYSQVEEQLMWQSRFRGYYADFASGDEPLRRAMIGAVHMLRLLGNADREFREFSDRPYGHPETDAAITAEALGLMAEWSWGENGLALARTLVAEAVARAESLPPARRLAYVHGLARTVRLGDDTALAQQLAVAIRALATESAEVEPWLDPADVRADLAGILDWAGPAADGSGADYQLPELRWAAEPGNEVDATMLAMRRALSSGDDVAAWAACQRLLARTTVNGFGWTGTDGEFDGRFSLGFMALVRSLFIEDHGDELHLYPHVPSALLPYPGALNLTTLATHFGLVTTETHFIGAGLGTVGVSLRLQPNRPFARIVVHAPFDTRIASAKGAVGGTATVLPDGTVECAPDVLNPRGLRFNIKLAQE